MESRVIELIKQFMEDNGIYTPEAIYQSDHVIANAYEFIEELCNEVGYPDDPDEDEEEID